MNNPSFECGEDECDGTTDASFVERKLCEWRCPTNGTSDSFSTKILNKACWASMPSNGTERDINLPHIGSILPHTGSRFSGMFTYSPARNPAYREYLEVKLESPLIPGEYYCAEMYVALAARPKYAANNLGMYFHNESKPRVPNGNLLSYIPQVLEKNVIMDGNWVKISGAFKATAASQYLTIGNFYDDGQTLAIDKTGYAPQADGYLFAYYFIDDVSVQRLPIREFTLVGNNIVCENEPAIITAKGELENVRWTTVLDTLTQVSDGPILNLKPATTTTYRVTGYNCTLFVKDTITVYVIPTPKVKLGRDTTICIGTILTLDAGEGTFKYHWQDNSTGQYKKVTQAGNYSVIVTNRFGCSELDEVKISTLDIPKVNLGLDTVVCKDFFPLTAGGKYPRYEWSTGSVDSIYTPTETGVYWVKTENMCGEAIDSITLYSYHNLFIPNVVTANADNKNDFFGINVLDSENKLLPLLAAGGELKVVNRWGTEIFSSNNYKNDWPSDKDDISSGTYFYTITYFDCSSYKGWVQVIR